MKIQGNLQPNKDKYNWHHQNYTQNQVYSIINSLSVVTTHDIKIQSWAPPTSQILRIDSKNNITQLKILKA